MFEKILIANRGEIACRIIRTARALGVRTVAVYSDVDAEALHVSLADEAYRLGPAPAVESYLRAEGIIEAALRSGAQAVHPGYGFLAENALFAEKCCEANLVFIGPPVEAIRAMGSKSAAKKIMAEAGVPLVPGYHGDDQASERLSRAAGEIGYPLLIKASAGGGGKGMRVVREPAQFAEALASARREAAGAFGDEKVLLEKYLERPRHVEIQVFADTAGNTVHLFERDCSVQRRHQKVVEEAPAPGMSEELRAQMGASAVAAAQAIGYVGAGTVEFLLDEDGSHYFMEMNTRLQVEHPVSEMITGQDLVEWQLRVAAGGNLPCRQQELTISGHAIEVRLYAEDPDRDFLPSIGRLRHLRTPAESAHLRLDTGIREGDEVTVHYDPMLAKLIVWDRDRPSALRRLQHALSSCQVAGVTTNLGFLARVANHPDFTEGAFDTGFVEKHRSRLFAQAGPAGDGVLALAALQVLHLRNIEAARLAAGSSDPYSPWHSTKGWRLNSDNHHRLHFIDGKAEVEVVIHYRQKGYLLELPGGELLVRGEVEPSGEVFADLGGRRIRATVVQHGGELTVMTSEGSHCLKIRDAYLLDENQEKGAGSFTAPMPGKVVALMAAAGDRVKQGAPLMVLEAMKMEHTITAPSDGQVTELNFAVGAQVTEGDELLAFQAD